MSQPSLPRFAQTSLAYVITLGIAALSALCAALWSFPAHAVEAAKGKIPAAPDELAIAGRALAAVRCGGCHGLDGNSSDPAYPKLAGQLETFLDLQLRNYRSGERPHPAMAAVSRSLSDREIRAVSRHYAGQAPMRNEGPFDPVLLRRGEAVFKLGKPGAPACQYCHGAAGQGLAPVFARLAGQHPDFIVASLEPYRRESAFGNPYAYVMKAVVQGWTDEDIRAVAAYIGSLR
jgi:cytochrome c553